MNIAENSKRESGKYRIALVDDHPIVRASIRVIIEQDTDYVIAGEASNGNELMDMLAKTKVDLILLDMNMPTLNGLQTIDLLAKKYRELAIIVLTSHKERILLKKALAKGARGYMLKEDTHDTLIAAIRDVRAGKRVISPGLAPMVLDDYASNHANELSENTLSYREKTILNLIVNGLKTREIAQKLNISARTIDSCRIRIREKINATTLAELVQYATEHDLM